VIAVARLLALDAVRNLLAGRTRRELLPLLVLGLLLALSVEVYAASRVSAQGDPEPEALSLATWGVLAAVAASALVNPLATRYPHRLADVAWLYTAPLRLPRIGLAGALLTGAQRACFWLCAALLIDAASLVRGEPTLAATGRAAVGVPLIVALALFAMGAASVRGRRWTMRLVSAAGLASLCVLVALALRDVVERGRLVAGLEQGLPSWLTELVGGMLLGLPTVPGVVFVVLLGATGVALTAAAGARLRETVTLEASFWAGFAPRAALPRRRRPPLRRGGRLRGAAAFTWFELAVIRQSGREAPMALALALAAAAVGRWEPDLLVLVIPLQAMGVLMSGYAAGAWPHLALGDLVLLPGRLAAKLAAAEAPHAVSAVLSLSLGLTAGAVAAGWTVAEASTAIAVGVVVIAVAFGVRVAAAALSYPPPTPSPALLLIRTIGLALLVGPLALFAISGLGAGPGSVLVALLAAALWTGGVRALARRTATVAGVA
jgi:sporulation killing factor system integral membrane protein